MKRITNSALGISLALGLFVHIDANAESVIIVHPDNPIAALSADDVSRIYLGKTHNFPDGSRAEPIDQDTGSKIREDFSEQYLDMSEAQVKRHWSKLMFSGKGRPPLERSGDPAVKSEVAGNAAAIGYIDSSNVDDSVKVIDVKR